MASQSSSPFPADDVVEAALRETVQDYFQRGEGDTVAVNNVRAAVEAQLELPAASLKNDAHWKNHSRAIVEDEFVCRAPPSILSHPSLFVSATA
jgi:hypothetical protein